MYIQLIKKKRRQTDGTIREDINYTAKIRFGRKHEFQRGTGETSRREALKVAREIAQELQEAELPRRSKHTIIMDMVFGHWWNKYASKKRSASDMKQRGDVVLNLIEPNTPVQLIDDDTVATLVENLEIGPRGPRKPATINRHIDILAKAIRIGRKNPDWKAYRDQFSTSKLIEWAENKGEEPGERVVIFSPSQARRVLAELPEHIAPACAFSIYTGMRLNELETLEWTNISLEMNMCKVHAKGGHERIVTLSEMSKRILGEPGNGLVFRLTNRRKHWEAARTKIECDNMRWHDLRHVMGSWLRQYGGLDLKAIGRAMGHNNLASTNRYVHVADKEVLVALNTFPDVISAQNGHAGLQNPRHV